MQERATFNLLCVDSLIVMCEPDEKLFIYTEATDARRTKHTFSDYSKDTENRFEHDFYRLFVVAANRLYFARSEGSRKRGKIVRVNLDTFEEVVLDKLADNIADFLVDENQTITYLTSQGELRQENPDNSSIPKTCVNLKNSDPNSSLFQSLCRLSESQFICTSYVSPNDGNLFILSDTTNTLFSQTIKTPEITAKKAIEGIFLLHKDYSFGVAQMCLITKNNVSFVICRLYHRYVQCLAVKSHKMAQIGGFSANSSKTPNKHSISLVNTIDITQ